MQLKTDDCCRLTSTDLFKPNASYEAEKTSDGAIRLVESPSNGERKARLVREGDLLVVETDREIDMEELNRELEDYL